MKSHQNQKNYLHFEDTHTSGESGYRKIKKSNYEILLDIGNIGPDYQPGHSHSDTFNFEFYFDGQPIIIDTGISTYEKNKKRLSERSTFSHNTVELFGKNQSQVWSGFRVAKRAKIISLKEEKNFVEATHDGYKNYGFYHNRSFKFEKTRVVIVDSINKSTQNQSSSYLHFHHGLGKPKIRFNKIYFDSVNIKFVFNKTNKIILKNFDQCIGFIKIKQGRNLDKYLEMKIET